MYEHRARPPIARIPDKPQPDDFGSIRYMDVPIEMRKYILSHVHRFADYIALLRADRDVFRTLAADDKRIVRKDDALHDFICCSKCKQPVFATHRLHKRALFDHDHVFVRVRNKDGLETRSQMQYNHRCGQTLGTKYIGPGRRHAWILVHPSPISLTNPLYDRPRYDSFTVVHPRTHGRCRLSVYLREWRTRRAMPSM